MSLDITYMPVLSTYVSLLTTGMDRLNRKRPKVTKGMEKTVGLFARKDTRMDSQSSISYGAGAKDLKAKSVAAALERVIMLIGIIRMAEKFAQAVTRH